MPTKQELLADEIQHIDIKEHDVVGLVDAMRHMAFQRPRPVAARPRSMTACSATASAA